MVHGVAACEVAGFLTGGFIFLYCGLLGAAAALAALEIAALAVGQLALLVLPSRLQAAAPSHSILPVVQPPNGVSTLHHDPPQLQSPASHEADPVADTVVVVKASSLLTQHPTMHVGNGTLQGGPLQVGSLLGGSSQQPAPEKQTTAEADMQAQPPGFLSRLSLWADQPASPTAAAAVMIEASLIDLGASLTLATDHPCCCPMCVGPAQNIVALAHLVSHLVAHLQLSAAKPSHLTCQLQQSTMLSMV